ncbi:MAG: hypothetical protein WC882_03155 [Candidatus Gracilibacteria bacterium]
MSFNRFKTALASLEVTRKWVLLSSAVIAVSSFLPWYKDLDAFGAGDLYLGVSGPLFLVGLMVLGTSLLIGAWIVLPALGKRLPRFPFKESEMFMFLGVQDLLFLFVANSVFFHPKFGLNVLQKETGFGMIVAFIGVFLLLWSGYNLHRKEKHYEIPREGRVPEPLIKFPEPKQEPRVQQERPTGPYLGNSPVISRPGINRPLHFGTAKHDPSNPSGFHRETPKPTVAPRETSTTESSGPQPLRMDL